jgi:hypothetical protein
MVARAAQLGEEGDVDGALEATKQADAIGRQHDTLYKQLTEPERTMTVCEICGVFINSTDNEQRRLVSGAGLGKGVWTVLVVWLESRMQQMYQQNTGGEAGQQRTVYGLKKRMLQQQVQLQKQSQAMPATVRHLGSSSSHFCSSQSSKRPAG